jgi:hypothetical protein
MKPRTAWQWIGLAAVVLVGAGIARAAVQGRDGVYWLGTGSWQLREIDGNAYLLKCPLPRNDWLDPKDHFKWTVSVPTIKSQTGRFLASDPEGRDPSVHLVAEKGANTRWVVEVVDRLFPGRSEERGIRAGPEGFTFRVKLAEGPFEDWYLAAEERTVAPRGRGPALRPLKLVRGARQASVFTYVETNYFVDHK